VLERGTWNVAEACREQPWLPNGPIPLNVTWTRPGYVRQGNYRVPDSLRPQPAAAPAAAAEAEVQPA
jgi:hypothetical protein